MKHSNFNTFTIVWGGVLQGKEASVRFVSDDRIEERRSEVRLNDKEVAKWLLP